VIDISFDGHGLLRKTKWLWTWMIRISARLGSPYRTSLNRTEPYRAFSSRIASPLGIFERELTELGIPMLALDNVRFK